MCVCAEAVERLVGELASLLEMLDGESLSAAAAHKMASVRDILDTLQASGSLIWAQFFLSTARFRFSNRRPENLVYALCRRRLGRVRQQRSPGQRHQLRGVLVRGLW